MTLPHSATIKTTFTALTLVLGATACEQYPLHDLGYTNGDPPGSNGDPDELPPVAEFANDFLGVWIGEADDPLALQSNADDSPPSYRFPSGSRRIRLELTDTEWQYPNGTLTFGDGVPPPAATDPNIGYPVDPDFEFNTLASVDASVRPPLEGFPYLVGPIHAERDLDAQGITLDNNDEFYEAGRVLDGFLMLSYYPTEVFGSWCALQTLESCAPRGFVFDEDNNVCFVGAEQTQIDCQKLALCESSACDCSEGPCTHSFAQSSGLIIRFSDDGLVGLFSGAVFVNERGFQQPLGTVHFRREE